MGTGTKSQVESRDLGVKNDGCDSDFKGVNSEL